MKLTRLLLYVSIIPRPGDELEQHTLFETVKFQDFLYGDLMIEAKAAVFVDRDDRVIPRPELINRLWKYFGQDGLESSQATNLTADLEALSKSVRNSERLPLEGFWIRLTGVVTEIVGNGCIVERRWDSDHKRIIGIEPPLVFVLAERIEFEADPLQSFPSLRR